ncbi:polysaccharide deacetylase family protein [Paenibacillus senegalensis]|uniref:polysaccharide deacetylase family protein n=1 Tax=Paenibacillus senegalensis TaxID=1465766 RepID=UPI0002886575|nr:polysaccharide deacetylase family protein [Paenibacillus senegalensis]
MKLGKRRINWRRFSLFIIFILVIFIGYNRVEALIVTGGGNLTAMAPAQSMKPPDDDHVEMVSGEDSPRDPVLPSVPPDSAPDDDNKQQAPVTGPSAPPTEEPSNSDAEEPLTSPAPPDLSNTDADKEDREEDKETEQPPSIPPDSSASGPDEQDGQREDDLASDGLKKVALTFDDGPDELWTPQVLDILRQYGIEATFFLVGTQAEKYPDMIPVILDEGHEIANHTWSHKKLTGISEQEVMEELRTMEAFLEEQIGDFSSLFRAPYGALSDSVRSLVANEGYKIVGWTVDPRDWEGTTPEAMLEIVKSQVSADGIILLHSFGGKKGDLSNTIEFLPMLIDYLLAEGYTIVKASDID